MYLMHNNEPVREQKKFLENFVLVAPARGVAGKVSLVGIFKRGGRVYTQGIDNIRDKIKTDSMAYVSTYCRFPFRRESP